MAFCEEVDKLSAEIESCEQVALALGSETRLHLIKSMIAEHQYNGLRVEEIAASTNLSRPAVSHHLQILKRAGIVKVRHEGTKNFYYFDVDDEPFDSFIHMLVHARALMKALPDRSAPCPSKECPAENPSAQ